MRAEGLSRAIRAVLQVAGAGELRRVLTDLNGERPLPISIHRSEDRKAVLGMLNPTVQGNQARPEWITVRGPYKKTVMAKGLQKELKGKETTIPALELKSPAPTKQRILLEAGVVLGAKRKRAWKREIERIWNRKFKLPIPSIR